MNQKKIALADAIHMLTLANNATPPGREMELCIRVLAPGSIGGAPCVAVKDIQIGFDWDHGKILLEPEIPLTRLSADDVLAIKEDAKKGQSWSAFQKYKAMRDEIEALKTEIARLKKQN